mmetsp:Transcript_74170/g.191351  ORF Transcript_74170/g.191351 Transcript_74170/m.191351 type:complete len:246 (+) Transcript_74170:388-1125(+)
MLEVLKRIAHGIATGCHARIHALLDRLVLPDDAASLACPRAVLGDRDLADIDVGGQADDVAHCPPARPTRLAVPPLGLARAVQPPGLGVVAATLAGILVRALDAIFECEAYLGEALCVQHLDLVVDLATRRESLRCTDRDEAFELHRLGRYVVHNAHGWAQEPFHHHVTRRALRCGVVLLLVYRCLGACGSLGLCLGLAALQRRGVPWEVVRAIADGLSAIVGDQLAVGFEEHQGRDAVHLEERV